MTGWSIFDVDNLPWIEGVNMFHTRDLGNFRVENRFCIAGSVPTFRSSNFFFFFL